MSSRRFLAPSAAVLTAASLASLAACGGGSSTASTAAPAPVSSGAAAAPAASGAPGGRGQGFDNEAFTQIRSCLAAAGIVLPTQAARPRGTFSPGARPTGFPTGRPTAFPSGRPTGAAGARGGGGFAVLQSAEAQAAIKACGLMVPQFGGGQGGAPAAPAQ